MDQGTPATPFAYRPLYVQVKDRLLRRLIDGSWQPGQLIPSEIELAREVGVSQGTIRKALDAMAGENLLVRRQGRGTFVALPEESRILFQFFRIVSDSGAPTFPESRVLDRHAAGATREQAAALDIAPGDPVWLIERVRALDEKPVLIETIVLPESRFAGFGDLGEVPNNVYGLYSERWGITIARASEKLRAIAARAPDAAALGCAPGHPMLEISRLAFDLENRPVEMRVSRCLTDGVHYSSELR